MRTADLDPTKHYSTCDGHRLELVEPVHARWARVKSDGNSDHRFIELDDEAVPGKRVDPWGKCHSNRADLGVRVKQFKSAAIDRNGDLVDTEAFDEVVLKPEEIAGTWKDYAVLHGATIRSKADEITEKQEERERKKLAEAMLAELLGVGVAAVAARVYTPHGRDKLPLWRIDITMTLGKMEELLTNSDA